MNQLEALRQQTDPGKLSREDVKLVSERSAEGVRLQTVVFPARSGTLRAASITAPTDRPPSGGMLFVHWYEPQASNSNRTQFQAEAESLARLGVASLSVETMWSDREWFIKRTHADDYRNSIDQLTELRAALALLRSQVDPDTPLAYVGHDFGAMYGVILGALEKAFIDYILMAGTPTFADWYFYYPEIAEDEREEYLERMAVIDPSAYVGELSPAPVLFQFGREDPHVPRAKAEAFFQAAQEPKEVRWYSGGHALDEQSALDRRQRLTSRFDLG